MASLPSMKRPDSIGSGGEWRAPQLGELVDRLKRRLTPRTRRVLLFVIIVFGGFGFGVAYGSWNRACAGGACPSIGVLESYRPTQALKVYAADGRLIREIGTEHRTVLRLEEMSPALPAAFVAVEDRRFFTHGGIDARGVARAVLADILCMSFCQGFSTITMQLARNVWQDQLPSTKSIQRKVREMRVALELERTYEKDRILELYLNQIYLGGSAYGVEAGAQRYFGKSARRLNVAEAALLAAIANVPGDYDPRRNPRAALQRRNLVLNQMRNQGYLSAEERERWKAYPIALSSRDDYGDVAPYFVEWVRQQLYARFGTDIYTEGYRVYTTLDLDMQIAAERALYNQLEAIEQDELFTRFGHVTYREYLEAEGPRRATTKTPYLQGGLITLDSDSGYVRAMVGGRDFGHSEYNRATQAERQAGSTFKPFVYSAAIRAGRPASYIINDGPISIMQNDSMPWEPQNFDEEFWGEMTMRRGLFMSRNLMAVNMGMEVGIRPVIGEAQRYGISTRLPEYPALFLGAASVIPLEMASAYTAFATLGWQAAPVGILRVEDPRGNIVWEPQVRRNQVMDRQHMWIVTSMLRDVVDRGTAFGAIRARGAFTHPAGGKTGTTNDGTDVWFNGFTTELVTVVWMGFDDPKKIQYNAQGGRLAAPVWSELMNEVYERRPAPPAWQQPDGLELAEIDNTTGYRATPFCPREARYFEWFIPGTEPTEPCPVHRFRFVSGGGPIPHLGGGH
jgi:penicillin-binding protein 1A